MRFLVDAQLPRRLTLWLEERGHEVIHTLDLALQNRTPDQQLLLALANKEQRILITKDTVFWQRTQFERLAAKSNLLTS